MDRVNSRLESVIEQMEQLIEQSKPVFLSSTHISVDRERLEDLVRQFKNNLPEEIEKYRRLLSNADIVEQDAREKADKLIADVHRQASEMISESEITNQATKNADALVKAAAEEAENIVSKARYEADGYLASAQAYLNDMLINLNGIIYDCIESTTRNTNRFLDSLNVVGQTVQDNLNELNAVPAEPEAAAASEPPSMFESNPDAESGDVQ